MAGPAAPLEHRAVDSGGGGSGKARGSRWEAARATGGPANASVAPTRRFRLELPGHGGSGVAGGRDTGGCGSTRTGVPGWPSVPGVAGKHEYERAGMKAVCLLAAFDTRIWGIYHTTTGCCRQDELIGLLDRAVESGTPAGEDPRLPGAGQLPGASGNGTGPTRKFPS